MNVTKKTGVLKGLVWLSTALLSAASAAGGSPQTQASIDSSPQMLVPGAGSAAVSAAPGPAHARVAAGYGKLPISFEPNVGQSSTQVKYTASGQGFSMALTENSALLSLRGGKDDQAASLSLKLVGSKPQPALSAEDKQTGVSNYFIGKDASKWHTGVANYGAVRYASVYPGIDWKIYGNPQQFEYDLIVAANADPAQIKLKLEGADELSLDAGGDLLVQVNGKTLRQLKPVVYQLDAQGERQTVDAQYRLDTQHQQFAFALGDYDHSRQLVIDPSFVYSTYLGGTGDDLAAAVAVDRFGNAYVAGFTRSTDFPTTAGSVQPVVVALRNGFITKLNADGSSRVYSTYLGGSSSGNFNDSFVGGIAVDSSGNAYVTGQTNSTSFPVVNPPPGAHVFSDPMHDLSDAFVAKLNAAGSALVYSTYLGGSSQDFADAIAVDSAGNAYVVGDTSSLDFPTRNAFQSSSNGSSDGFVTKFNPSGSALSYSTYLGGSNFDEATGIAVDAAGSAYVTGRTGSTDFPTQNPIQAANAGGLDDAFITKLDPSGQTLAYSTYLGGSGSFDEASKIAVDSAGSAYVAGQTSSADFPTHNAVQSVFGGVTDAFIAKLNPAGTALVYSSFFGGSGSDSATGVAVDAIGEVYFVGETQSTNFPTVSPLQGARADTPFTAGDAFVTELNPAGSAALFSSYLGGAKIDVAASVAVDNGNVYIVGGTDSTNFPVASALQPTSAGGPDSQHGGISGAQEGFVTKLSFDTTPDAFHFTDVNNVARNSLQTSDAVTISGIEAAAPISVSGGLYSIGCTASFTGAVGVIGNGQTVCVRHTSSASFSTAVDTTLNIGGVADTYTSTTSAPDTTPDSFTFVDPTNVPRNSLQTSNAVTISGIDAPAPVSVSGGMYSIGCTAIFTATAGTISNGQKVCVRHTSSASFSTAVNTTLNIGGVADTFTSTTSAADTTPNPFTFIDQTNVPRNSVRTSNAVTITGIDAPAPISVSGGVYSIGCTATFTATAGTISAGQTVCVRHTSSASFNTSVNTTLSVGGVSDTFTSVTAPNAVAELTGVVFKILTGLLGGP